jgi:hypothetical protein
MIVKFGQSLDWLTYERKSKSVKALRMKEDFLFETQRGWVQGYKGQWLVELGEGLRCNLDHEAFSRTYIPSAMGDKICET